MTTAAILPKTKKEHFILFVREPHLSIEELLEPEDEITSHFHFKLPQPLHGSVGWFGRGQNGRQRCEEVCSKGCRRQPRRTKVREG